MNNPTESPRNGKTENQNGDPVKSARIHRLGRLVKIWVTNPERIRLLRWSVGFFTLSYALTLLVALRYFSVYHVPSQPLGIIYTVAAFTGHFGSILLILWTAPVLLVLLLVPVRRIILPLAIFIAAVVLTLVLLDSQLYTTRRFHFTFLTIKLFGVATWGFGVLYLAICSTFLSFTAKIVWERFVVKEKRLWWGITLPVILVTVLFTHLAHIWADAKGYTPITRFTSVLPLFYPSTDKKQMMRMGIIDISQRRDGTSKEAAAELQYPLHPLSFSSSADSLNILLIMVDGMRSDVLSPSHAPQCVSFAEKYGTTFTNHWSGGNSTKMGCFSLFYGIPPTYEQYFENNKKSPLFIDRLLDMNYRMGIFTSYRLYTPATLDITAFVKIPDLRLETKIPGPFLPYRNDSAITEEWKSWLDTIPAAKPFFGFLFYDAILKGYYPPSYKNRVEYPEKATEDQKSHARYVVSMEFVDSLVGEVVRDLEKRSLLKKTVVIITADHGVEFDDNHLGFKGHGSAFSEYQVHVPLIVHWPGREPTTVSKRTSHFDIVATVMHDGLGCNNPEPDYCSGNNLFSDREWDWHIVGSYYNFAVLEPDQVTIQYPGGYYECRDNHYRLLQKARVSSHVADAFTEMGRFYK